MPCRCDNARITQLLAAAARGEALTQQEAISSSTYCFLADETATGCSDDEELPATVIPGMLDLRQACADGESIFTADHMVQKSPGMAVAAAAVAHSTSAAAASAAAVHLHTAGSLFGV